MQGDPVTVLDFLLFEFMTLTQDSAIKEEFPRKNEFIDYWEKILKEKNFNS